MIRLLSRPGLLTSAVVAMSVASGLVFGVAAVSGLLVARAMRGRP